MENIGLVLEGGGLRGLYTAGVLDYFMEKNLYFPYVIGVSMGATNAVSYISKQIGRSKIVNTKYINDPRYMSYCNYLKEKSFFGMRFIFDEIPHKLHPFDFEAFFASKQKFYIVTMNCKTGESVYFEKNDCGDDLLTILQASCSLPFMAPIIHYKGQPLLDGGISNPLPIKKSIADGNEKNVVILTQNKGYRKKAASPHAKFWTTLFYRKYRVIGELIQKRHQIYNDTLDYIEELEAKGQVIIIRPIEPLKVKRIDRDYDNIMDLYQQGYRDAKAKYPEIKNWFNRKFK